MDPKIVVPEVLAIGLAFTVVPAIAIAAVGAGGTRAVACPENGTVAAVGIDRGRAVLRMFTDARHRVASCSRWPERAGCDRACEAGLT